MILKKKFIQDQIIMSQPDSLSHRFDRGDLISSSDIETNDVKWASVDNFSDLLNQKDAFIINTDLDSGGGIHWITLFVRDGICYIVDSLGPDNKRPNDKIMFKIIKDSDLKYQLYPHSFQYGDSSFCGWFAIYTCVLINRNKNADVFELIHDVFGDDADDSDIEVLINAFGMNGKNTLDKKYDLNVKVNGAVS